MDQNDLGLARYDAGAEYLTALRKLGLDPEALFWAFDREVNQLVLVLVTKFFDFAGPLALSELLFKAYRASATPVEIDPFILRLHSPKQKIFRELTLSLQSTGSIPQGWDVDKYHRAVLANEQIQNAIWSFKYADLEGFGAWIYTATDRKIKLADAARPWTRFTDRVDALAA